MSARLVVSATRNHDGAWVVAAIVDGYRKFRMYYGYTKREAMRQFRKDVR